MSSRFKLAASLCSLSLLSAIALSFATRQSQASLPSLATGKRGMVSTAHPIATQAGLEVLEAGGNAFDAAIAIGATLTVVEPYNSSVGGYGLMLIYDAKTGRTRALNSSGRIPKAVDSDVFRPPTPNYLANRVGAKAISTPGVVNGWEALWKEYGSLKWERLFDPAIKAADEGFILSRGIGDVFHQFSDYTKSFYGRDGKPLQAGDRLVQKDLANSFRLIAREGARAIQGGKLGQAIDAEMRARGSFLRLSDLIENKAEWGETVSLDYRGYKVVVSAPPANSFSSLISIGIMSYFDLPALGHNSTAYLHRFAEATKHGFWCRLAYASDPEIKRPPLDKLLSKQYLEEQAKKIDPRRASRWVAPGLAATEGSETTHFVVADEWGNIVTATQTLGHGYGSKIMVKGTGIWLNNSLAFCTFEPKGNPMDAHPGRRKLASFNPAFVFKGDRPIVAIGTPGGHTIPQTVAQVILNYLSFGLDIQQAIAAPRISFTEEGSFIVEGAIPQAVRDELAAMGHQLRVGQIGNAHGLTIEYNAQGKPIKFTGGADPRGQGLARGR